MDKKSKTLLAGLTIAGFLAGTTGASALTTNDHDTPQFQIIKESGKTFKDDHGEGSCGEGSCGEGKCSKDKKDKDKDGEGSCGEGSCGSN